MTDTWISPWSGNELSVADLLREVSLDALSHHYVLSTLELPDPITTIDAESITLNSPCIDYNYVIYFPRELHEEMESGYHSRMTSLKQEFAVGENSANSQRSSGEKLGSLLQYFNSLDRLIRMVMARQCWSDSRVLALHGYPLQQSVNELTSDLDQAEISYLLLYPLSEPQGSGAFRMIDAAEAISLVNGLWHKQSNVIGKLFQLDRDYGEHEWMSNNNRWVLD